MVAYTRQLALSIIEEDPSLNLPKNSRLKQFLESSKDNPADWGKIS